MAKLLFRLRHVTDEEAMEVRDLLAAHGFDTYETQAGFFPLGGRCYLAAQPTPARRCHRGVRRLPS
ncbi:hypothetical protein HSBAA_03490 [Vreelandella sulfidaeris]|uniref:Uncharacterized protein n=1 Tax=Vreelandella sulfidaeris TaxID=115553 RepID=A0A455U1K3_9GAMM|nr:hypothetical protein HSBAA_03490 [Halomonas sulfidaeris]